MIKTKDHLFAGSLIVSCEIPNYLEWVRDTLFALNKYKKEFEYSHLISNRWENAYLPIDLVPSVKIPMKMARDLVKKKWNLSTVALFEPYPKRSDSRPPFWFNISKVGESTGIHDHAKQASISGVVYLECKENSGDLIFKKKGVPDVLIEPKVGNMILFRSSLKHGVLENKSFGNRISLAFNLFPFPLPFEEW